VDTIIARITQLGPEFWATAIYVVAVVGI